MRFAALALVVAVACGQATTSARDGAAATAGAHAQVTHTPVPVNVDDMMGGARPAATVFTRAGNEIFAVTLLNHFVRYRIAVSGKGHAVVSPDGARVYVADRTDGRTRVRAFEVISGTELGSMSVREEAADGRALAMDRNDRVLLLVKAGTGVRVQALGTSPLATVGGISKAPCGERLLASESRIAVVCSNGDGQYFVGGTVGIDTLAGHAGYVQVPGSPIVASAMLQDGTIVLGTKGGSIYRIVSGKTSLSSVMELGTDALVEDGIAPTEGGFVIFARSGDASTATVYEPYAAVRVAGPFQLSLRGPRIAALGPFAYFAGERGLWHVDLRSGLLERMLTLDDPTPLAVSAR